MKKRTRLAAADPRTEPAPTPQVAAAWLRIESFLEHRAILVVLALVLLATIRIVTTYSSLSHTFDEPAHIAAGMEWLDKHVYNYEAQHPPLTRVMSALLPFLTGSRSHGERGMWDEGFAILFASGSEERTLALARLGILPFFWIACWVTYACTRWIAGAAAAVLAVFFLTTTPAILAHAGLATTDMGLTAMIWLAFYTGWRWALDPSWKHAVAFGAFTGLATLAKLSILAFFPSTVVLLVLLMLILERPGPSGIDKLILDRLPQLVLAIGIGVLLIWIGYRCSYKVLSSFPYVLPAPEFFDGIADVSRHNTQGHLTYLLGQVNTVGWPSFYLVALAVKTPLALLALGLGGLALLFSRKMFGLRGWLVPCAVIGIMAFSSVLSQIRIGTRHVLPVTPTTSHTSISSAAIGPKIS
ncbi:MAG: glycosyltransferase family 39 protein [Bryobacteraceae bacterium]